ncbi:MAG TPA: DUF72 domain-containing protein [Chromatiales bacterium]|nr:DUF72 domain-containing protein [Chromatiales bacterium]HEX22045.1 DUF72 domain-containing protein [Chromatiales bacterium]
MPGPQTKPGRFHVGTSGWAYPHWKGPFYPEDLPDRERLAYYARHFSCVEINNSFYRLPSEHNLASWRDSTPADFLFAVKASRYLTHMKKLKNPQAGLDTFFQRIDLLGDKLGPVLFQLPPRWRCNPGRLEAFLRILCGTHRHAFEFRDTSWINDAVLALLEQYGAAFCIYDLAGYRTPLHLTADFVYVRLHGPGDAYQGSYDERTLSDWAARIREWQASGLDVHCYFDNDQAGYAVDNARNLQALLQDGTG